MKQCACNMNKKLEKLKNYVYISYGKVGISYGQKRDRKEYSEETEWEI